MRLVSKNWKAGIGIAIGLILGAPIVLARSNPAVSRAAEQLTFQSSAERLSIQPRPRFAYLVGDMKSTRILTSEQEQGIAQGVSRENPTVLIEILPAGRECLPPAGVLEDNCPIPFPIAPMPPLPSPPPLPLAEQRLRAPEGTEDLTIRWTEDDRLTMAATGQAPFLVVAEGRIYHLLPSMKITVAPPMEVFRLLAVGSFAPELELAADATDFTLLPCPGQPWDQGLCTPERVQALLQRQQ